MYNQRNILINKENGGGNVAVVRDYYTPEGCHIIVHDDCYKDKTPEETQEIVDRVSKIVLQEEFRKFVQSQ